MKKLLFVMCRGGWDGISIVIPTGDAEAAKRSAMILGTPLPLTDFWSLNFKASNLHSMAQAGEAIFVQAVATPYRARSHFDGMQVLESGGTVPFGLKDGWLNRLLGLTGMSGAASGITVPLSLVGAVPVPAYSKSIPALPAALRDGIAKLWGQDPQFAELWPQLVQSESVVITGRGDVQLVSGLLTSPAGPDVVTMEFLNWDTHLSQPYALGGAVLALDEFLGAVRSSIGEQWDDTLVVVCSEFGRSVASRNGTGTDHGNGGLCMLLGAVKSWTNVSKPVLVDWPGLAIEKLYEGRDLMPTRDLRSVLLAAVCRHFGLNAEEASPTLFPDSSPVVADAALV